MSSDHLAQKSKSKLIELLRNFDSSSDRDLRTKVLELIPMWEHLGEIGCSLIPKDIASSARERILHYFRRYPKTIISHKELQIIGGISEWARRVRELRVEHGWEIVSGIATGEMYLEGEFDSADDVPPINEMKPDDYIMFSTVQDKEAAYRWNIAKTIRNSSEGSKSKILAFLRKNVGSIISGEELRYVAKGASEWARRVRELRTEDGWRISTYWSGRPDLSVGEYILEQDRQLPVHDRKIDDHVRKKVLERDKFTCQDCHWQRKNWSPDLPRHLELHHILPHKAGGESFPKNLRTLCNKCHDEIHKKLNIE